MVGWWAPEPWPGARLRRRVAGSHLLHPGRSHAAILGAAGLVLREVLDHLHHRVVAPALGADEVAPRHGWRGARSAGRWVRGWVAAARGLRSRSASANGRGVAWVRVGGWARSVGQRRSATETEPPRSAGSGGGGGGGRPERPRNIVHAFLWPRGMVQPNMPASAGRRTPYRRGRRNMPSARWRCAMCGLAGGGWGRQPRAARRGLPAIAHRVQLTHLAAWLCTRSPRNARRAGQTSAAARRSADHESPRAMPTDAAAAAAAALPARRVEPLARAGPLAAGSSRVARSRSSYTSATEQGIPKCGHKTAGPRARGAGC